LRHLALEIDQIARRGAPDVLQLVLLLRGEAERLRDLRTPPPLSRREVGGERRRGDQQCQEGECPALRHSELPLCASDFVSSHVSHWTKPWKSRSSSDCQASCTIGSSTGTFGWTATVFVACCTTGGIGLSTVSYTTVPPRTNASTAAAATRHVRAALSP